MAQARSRTKVYKLQVAKLLECPVILVRDLAQRWPGSGAMVLGYQLLIQKCI